MGTDKYTPEMIARTREMIGDRVDEMSRWDRDLARWAASIDRDACPEEREAAVRIEDAQLKRGAAMERLSELRKQTGDADGAWSEMRDAIDLAWGEAKEAYQRAKESLTSA